MNKQFFFFISSLFEFIHDNTHHKWNKLLSKLPNLEVIETHNQPISS